MINCRESSITSQAIKFLPSSGGIWEQLEQLMSRNYRRLYTGIFISFFDRPTTKECCSTEKNGSSNVKISDHLKIDESAHLARQWTMMLINCLYCSCWSRDLYRKHDLKQLPLSHCTIPHVQILIKRILKIWTGFAGIFIYLTRELFQNERRDTIT